MTLYIVISTYVRDEMKRLSQRYADRMEKYSNVLALTTNFMKEIKATRRLKEED